MEYALDAEELIFAVKHRTSTGAKAIIKAFFHKHYALYQFQEESQNALIDAMRIKTFRKGDTIFKEGDEVGMFSEIYVCLLGKMTLYKNNSKSPLGHLRTGDLFGEGTNLRSRTVKVASNLCSLVAFPHKLFLSLIEKEDHFVLFTSGVRRTLMKAPRDRKSAEIEYTSKFLKNFYFFEEVPDELLLCIVADLKLKHYPAEQRLCVEGEVANKIFFVLRGQLRIGKSDIAEDKGPHQYHLHRTDTYRANKPKFSHFHKIEKHANHDQYVDTKHVEGILQMGDVFGINSNANHVYNVFTASLFANTNDVEVLVLSESLFSSVLGFRHAAIPTFMGSAKRALSIARESRQELEVHAILRLLNSLPLYKFFVQVPFCDAHQVAEVVCYKNYDAGCVIYSGNKHKRLQETDMDIRTRDHHDKNSEENYFMILLAGACVEEDLRTKQKVNYYPGDCFVNDSSKIEVNLVSKESCDMLYLPKKFYDMTLGKLATKEAICFQPSKIIPWLKLVPEERKTRMLRHIARYLVKSNEFFSAIPIQVVENICADASIATFPSSTAIVLEGDPASHACILLEGVVAVHYLGHSQVNKENARKAHELTEKEVIRTFGTRVATLQAGDCFGEGVESLRYNSLAKKSSLESQTTSLRSASIISMMKCRVLKISKYHWNKYLAPLCKVNQMSLFRNSYHTEADYSILLKSLSRNAFFRQFISKSTAMEILRQSSLHMYRPKGIICFEKDRSEPCITIIIRGSVNILNGASKVSHEDCYKRQYKRSLVSNKTLYASTPFFFRGRSLNDLEEDGNFRIEEVFGHNFVSILLTAGDSFECYEHAHPHTILAGELGAACLSIPKEKWQEITCKHRSSLIMQPEHLHRCLEKAFPSNRIENGNRINQKATSMLRQCLAQIAPEICNEVESSEWKQKYPNLDFSHMGYHKYSNQQCIWKVDDSANFVLAIIEGAIELRNADGKPVMLLTRGSTIGGLEVILEYKEGRPFSAHSIVETRCVCISRGMFKKLRHPKEFREKCYFFRSIDMRCKEKEIAALVYLSKHEFYVKGEQLIKSSKSTLKKAHKSSQSCMRILYKGVAEVVSNKCKFNGTVQKVTSALKLPGSLIHDGIEPKTFFKRKNILAKTRKCEVIALPLDIFGEKSFLPLSLLDSFRSRREQIRAWHEKRDAEAQNFFTRAMTLTNTCTRNFQVKQMSCTDPKAKFKLGKSAKDRFVGVARSDINGVKTYIVSQPPNIGSKNKVSPRGPQAHRKIYDPAKSSNINYLAEMLQQPTFFQETRVRSTQDHRKKAKKSRNGKDWPAKKFSKTLAISESCPWQALKPTFEPKSKWSKLPNSHIALNVQEDKAKGKSQVLQQIGEFYARQEKDKRRKETELMWRRR